MEKKALLLGGTGAMGVYLSDELKKRGYTVFVTSRTPKKSSVEDIIFLQGNAMEDEFLSGVLNKNHWNIIVDFMIYSTEEFKNRVNLLLHKTEQYIFVSSYRVFAKSESLITESSPHLLDVLNDKDYLRSDEYALAKSRQEKILRNSASKNWTIIRPSITYSKQRFQLATMEADIIFSRAANHLPVGLPKEILERKTTMTWAGDVASMISGLANNNDSYGQDFNVVTAESLTWQEVAKIYEDTIGLKIVEIGLNDYFKFATNKYQVMYDRLIDRELDNRKILKYSSLSQENLTSIKLGLAQEIQQFIASDSKVYINFRDQAKMDFITNVKMSLEEATLKNRISYCLNYTRMRLSK
ncbi:NAD-dependent epimerase/dehydratase family protein [Enterococcus sp. LJL90]